MKTYLLVTAILAAFLLAACGDSTTTTNSNNTATNRPVNGTNTGNGALTPTTPTPEATTNNAPTLTPVYKAYCAAWVKKDEAALRKVYSSDTIADFERQMKEDNIRSLADFLSDDKASNELCEARNEKITGDTATAEVRTLGYPNGITVVFVKENGEWKLTNRRPEGALK
ncbi:MAG TPA: nuclear transport factor 2 family protein [Pyrinomonadaceae bacterium]